MSPQFWRGALSLVLIAWGSGSGAFAQQSAAPRPIDETVLAAYVEAQEALANDDLLGARSALARVAARADGELKPLAEEAVRSPDMVAIRAAFKPLSAAIIMRQLPPTHAVAWCPMYDSNKGANWVQKQGEIANPYFGSSMLRCGSFDQSPGSHMDHSPRFGGVFFMAPDAWHHIEGTYPQTGVFRLRVYDNFTQTVNVQAFKARAVVKEIYDEMTREYREIEVYPLVPSADGMYFEAQVGSLASPAEITAKVTFDPSKPEERFDFVFMTATPEVPRTAPATTATSPTVETAPLPTLRLFDGATDAIPATPDAIVGEILARDTKIQELIRTGAFTEVFIPALEAKELALALEPHLGGLPAPSQRRVESAVKAVVRAAWLLDWYGDLGNRVRVNEAYGVFGPAIAEIRGAYGIESRP